MSSDIGKIDLFIGGEYCPPSTGVYFDDLHPDDDSVWRVAAAANADDVNRAVINAHMTWKNEFRQSTPRDRETWLNNAANIIDRDKSRIAHELCLENGSPLIKARFEVRGAIDAIRTAAGIARMVNGQTHQSDVQGRIVMSVREPIGVCASITPFNVPFLKAAKLSAGALAVGNTVVGLASEFTPNAPMNLAKIYKEAGFPDGAYNQLTGFGADIGDFLTTHPMVKAVLFTGSSAVGKHISEICGRQMKRAVLQLGSKSPALIMNDADLEQAAMSLSMSCFLFQGQGCMATSRIICEEKAYKPFLSLLKKRAEHICDSQMGDLKDPTTWVGPILSEGQREHVRAHLDDALKKGAVLVTGGEWVGNRCQPTLLTNVTPEMKVCRSETLGPVASIYKVRDFEEGIAMANDTDYGLSSSIWTANINQAMEYTRRIESGTTHVNAGTFFDEPHVPFGGVKDSGVGRQGSSYDIDELTELKLVTIQLPGEADSNMSAHFE